MKKTRSGLAALALSLLATTAFSQNVAINEDGSLPDPNAILDVKSSTKGLLIPRVDAYGRRFIPNTKGLLVFDTTDGAFWYNTGTTWKSLASDGNSWLINGNTNIPGFDTTKFLGTSGTALRIRVNNQPSGLIDAEFFGSTYWGFNAGAHSPFPGNTAMGYYAMPSNKTGTGNTAIGIQALKSSFSGSGNTAIGANSMFSDSTGLSNTAVGMESMYFSKTGQSNVAIGNRSMYYNSNAWGNTATGNQALYYNTTGIENTANGYVALFNHTSGSGNTAIGSFALNFDTTGENNTAIGIRAGVSKGNLTNATAIGASAIVNASNKVRIGNSSVTVIEGQVPFTTPSDGRYKYQVKEDVKGLDFIMQLRPVTYQFDVKRFDAQQRQGQNDKNAVPASNIIQASYDEAAAIRRSGFIAQEVEKAADASGYNFSGIIKPKTAQEHYSLSYESFVVPLVKGMQEQQQLINRHEQTIRLQEQKLAEQDAKAAQQEKKLAELQQQLSELNQLVRSIKSAR